MAHDQDPRNRPTDPNARPDEAARQQNAHPLSDDVIEPLPVDEGSLADVDLGQLTGGTDPASDLDIPLAEVEPLLSAEPIDTGSNTDLADLFASTEAPSDPLLPGSDEIPFADLAPASLAGSASDLFSHVPTADPASGSNLTLPGSSSDLFTKDVPTTEAGSGSNLFGETAASKPSDSKSGSDVGVGKWQPVAPGSGWLDSQEGEAHSPPLPEPVKSKSEFELNLPEGVVGGSDIFSGPVPASKSGDQSDVIAATAAGEVPPAPPAAPSRGDRNSDFALTFDQPPGGSTVQDLQASDDLPVADEVSDSIVGSTAELPSFGPGVSAKTPPMSEEDYLPLHDDSSSPYDSQYRGKGQLPTGSHIFSDLGGKSPGDTSSARVQPPAKPPVPPNELKPSTGSTDEDFLLLNDEATSGESKYGGKHQRPTGSHIFSDLGGKAPGDSSSIQLESPDQISDAPRRPQFHGSTEADFDLPDVPPRPRSESTLPSFELTPSGGGSSDDLMEATLDQATLAEDQSSIFSGEAARGPAGADTSSVPLDAPEANADAVEFSAHPDVRGADSKTLHTPSTSSVELEWADQSEGPSTSVGLGAAGLSPAGPSSSNIHSAPPASDPSSQQVASIEELLRAAEAERATPPGKSGRDTEPSIGMHDPSVEIDWMAQSSEEVALPSEGARGPRSPAAAEARSRPTAPPLRSARDDDDYDDNEATLPQPAVEEERRRPERARGGKGGMLVGALLGLVLGAGGASGLFLSGVLGSKDEGTKPGGGVASPGGGQVASGGGPVEGGAAVSGVAAEVALIEVEPRKAVEAIEKAGATTPESKAALGRARFLARIRELAAANATVAPNDSVLQQARADFEAAATDASVTEATAVQAMLNLGLTHELAGDRDRARSVYTDALQKYPNSAEIFQAALDRLAATEPGTKATSLRLTPENAKQLATAVTLLFAVVQEEAPAAPAASKAPAEPGIAFWKAINSAAAGKYDDAIKQIAEARKLHVARAKALAGRGLNPLTDPLEQIFPRCCDDLTAYWTLRKSLYEHPAAGALVKKEGITKALDQMAAAEKRSIDLMKSVTELKKDNESLAGDLKKEKDAVAVIEKDLKAEKALVDRAGKELKAQKVDFDKMVEKYRQDIVAATKESDKLAAALKKTQDVVESSRATLAAIGKELQGGKLLPAKHTDAELLAATRSAVSRATGPDLSKLIPPELSAVAGTGLTTAHILTLANRINKSEAAADALAAELKKAKADYVAEIKSLSDSHKADLKKLTDSHAADLKKLQDTQALALKKAEAAGEKEIEKLKESQKSEIKKLAAQYAADLKKLTDDQRAAVKKLEDANEARVKGLEAALAVEKAAAASAEKRFRADLANAISPADALDIWLPLIVELRRPADADGALDAANKVLKTATTGTDDAGKALTLAGLAQLLKGNGAAARDLLTQARNSPAYRLAKSLEEKQKKTGWATAADLGFATVTDPAAPARLPASSDAGKRDAVAAARFLDAGINAYKAGRYADAEKALAEAAWHDPSDALAWYFLGAARWEAGKRDAAKADFQQGAERELARAVPTRIIDNALRPIQGSARDALASARP